MSKTSITIRTNLVMILSLVIVSIAVLIGGFQLSMRKAMKKDIFGTNRLCSLPCWNDIIPGVTTQDQALEILERIPYIDQRSIQRAGTNASGGYRWAWRVAGRRIQPSLSWQNGVVQEITLSIAFELTVREILDRFGVPEAIDIMRGGTPEYWYWIIDMFYPQSGVQVKVYTPEFSSLVEPSTEVGVVILFPPTSIEKRMKILYPNTGLENIHWLSTHWKGYGDLSKLYGIQNEK